MVLEIQDLRKSFVGPDGRRTTIIDIPQLRVPEGQHLGLAGGSGMGKTTLLHLVAGILQPDAGRITIDGVAMTQRSEPHRDQLRGRSIGYIFQTFNLLQGYTALENVDLAMMLGRGRDRARAVQLLQRVGMGDRLHHKPRQLSVGQQQRVALARALANAPRLVLADEPTGNLDPARAREAIALIREACRETSAALLLVSHDRNILGQLDAVIELAELNRAAAESPA